MTIRDLLKAGVDEDAEILIYRDESVGYVTPSIIEGGYKIPNGRETKFTTVLYTKKMPPRIISPYVKLD